MAENLTPQQQEAVSNRGGKLLVSAAAGSGKTKVLVDRLMSYLTDSQNPANLDEFLIITYTNAAASELRGKIAAKLTEYIARYPENKHLQKQMQRIYLANISTVHGFCSKLLREYAYQLDLSADFRVAEDSECTEMRSRVIQDLLDNAYNAMGEDPAFCAFVDSQGIGRNDADIPDIIEKVYDASRCHLDPAGWLAHCTDIAALGTLQDASETMWGEYLIGRLNEFLDEYLSIFNRILDKLNAEGLDKVSTNIDSLVRQLQALRKCRTWDEIKTQKDIVYDRFPPSKKYGLLAEQVKEVRDKFKSQLEEKVKPFAEDSAHIFEHLQTTALATQGLANLVSTFAENYRKCKRSRHVLDYADLEHYTLDLLLGKNRTMTTAAARTIGARFREVMVDEYQDSNSVQDAIVSALTEQKHNCFLVGDVKQSIYRFRLADPGIFLEKYKAYAPADGAEAGRGRKVLLSHNFRSGPEIIEGINDVFYRCMSERVGGLDYGDAEALREGVPHTPLPDPAVELYTLETDGETYQEEAAFTAERIRKMLEDGTLIRQNDGFRRVTPDDIVILLRSPHSTGRYYQSALEKIGIRCTMDNERDLLQTEEIGVLRSILTIVANPRQDIPLLSALASPVFGFTANDLAAFRGKMHHETVYEALLPDTGEKATRFKTILAALRSEARTATLTQLLEKCILLTGIDRIYTAMPDGALRKANIQEFYQTAINFEKSGVRTLEQFLEYLTTTEEKGLSASSGSSAGSVTIMSIHKSKGLEFPVVFLCCLSRRFNGENRQQKVLCDQKRGLGMMVTDNMNRIRSNSMPKNAIIASMKEEDVSEEMRVLYVAMTRARDRLIMVYSIGNLAKALQEIALRLPLEGSRQLCRQASKPGDWILIAAMQRTEAGELQALSGTMVDTAISRFPWKICAVQSHPDSEAETVQKVQQEPALPIAEETLRKALDFRYAHIEATVMPSKQTATGRNGRMRADEVYEHTPQKKFMHHWRKPAFAAQQRDGKAYGSMVHNVMQNLDYSRCSSADTIMQQIQEMTDSGFLDASQAASINASAIAAFFSTTVGKKLTAGVPYVREFKFSILDDASKYGQVSSEEKILLQGVVDCALLEPDGITIIDYKTDHIGEADSAAAEKYRTQVTVYAEAMERIYQLPVKAKYLYFFHRNLLVEL